MRRLHPQGLSLDFIRHFVFWEKVRPATLHSDIPNACFCRYCVAGFAAKTGIQIPESKADTPLLLASDPRFLDGAGEQVHATEVRDLVLQWQGLGAPTMSDPHERIRA